MISAARENNALRFSCVATTVPLPAKASPMASLRQFIELAVNIPEHEPQPGQAEASISSASASVHDASALITMASMRSTPRPRNTPASIGPPDTKTTGMLRRMAAMSIPGVILSQFDMHTKASTLCALAMYSTLSAIMSREGSE